MSEIMKKQKHCPLEMTCSIDVFGREGTIECVGDYETCYFLKLRKKENVSKMPQGSFLKCEYAIKKRE